MKAFKYCFAQAVWFWRASADYRGPWVWYESHVWITTFFKFMWAIIRNRDWRIASLFVALLLSSCNTYHDMYGNKYSAAGGDGDVTFPGGGHLTYSQTASLQHVVQGVVALGGSIAGAVAQKSSDALSATKDTNAAGVANNAANQATIQNADKLKAASTDLSTTTHAQNAVELSTILKKGPPAPK